GPDGLLGGVSRSGRSTSRRSFNASSSQRCRPDLAPLILRNQNGIRVIRGRLFSGHWCLLVSIRGSILLLLAEFLQARIVSQRIEHRIESEQRRSERHVSLERALAWYREHLL